MCEHVNIFSFSRLRTTYHQECPPMNTRVISCIVSIDFDTRGSVTLSLKKLALKNEGYEAIEVIQVKNKY